MRKIVVTIMLCLSLSPLHAQMEEWGGEKIDSAFLICQYKYSYSSLINRDKMTDDMRLEIGKKITKFYSYLTLSYDSLCSTPEGPALIRRTKQQILSKVNPTNTTEENKNIFFQLPFRHSSFTVYTNYPSQKILVQDRIGQIDCTYEEEMTPQEWVISEDTLSIIGYLCQKATCSWRGRDYTAWFTTEIPISKGPMKFYGLPGLIMKVEDAKQEYSFEIKGIQKIKDKPIYLNKPLKNKEYLVITRKEFAKRTARLTNNRIRSANSDLSKISATGISSDETTDLMELDYK